MSDVTNNTPNVSQEVSSPQATPEGSATQVAPAQQAMSPAQMTAFRAQLDRDKALRSREQAVKQAESQVKDLQDLKELLQKNPLEALQRVGVTYDDITRRVGAGERPDPVAPVISRVEQLEAELSAAREREELNRQQTILSEERSKIKGMVAQSTEYPALKAAEAGDAVFEYVKSVYEQTGDWMDWSVAAKQLNDNLITLAKKLAPLAVQDGPGRQPVGDDGVDTITRDMRSPAPTASTPSEVTDIGALRRKWTEEASRMLRTKSRD